MTVRRTAHMLMNHSASKTLGWHLKARSGFKPRLGNVEASVRTSRPSCQLVNPTVGDIYFYPSLDRSRAQTSFRMVKFFFWKCHVYSNLDNNLHKFIKLKNWQHSSEVTIYPIDLTSRQLWSQTEVDPRLHDQPISLPEVLHHRGAVTSEENSTELNHLSTLTCRCERFHTTFWKVLDKFQFSDMVLAGFSNTQWQRISGLYLFVVGYVDIFMPWFLQIVIIPL